MFRRCLELEPVNRDTELDVQLQRPTEVDSSKRIFIRILKGSASSHKPSATQQSSPRKDRHAPTIHHLNKSPIRKESRSTSVDIKGPGMDVDKIRRTIIDMSASRMSNSRPQKNLNSIRCAIKPSICYANSHKRDMNMLQNLETRESEESAIRWMEGRFSNNSQLNSQKSQTPQSPNQLNWQRPYLLPQMTNSRRKHRGDNVLNTIESLNCSEDSNYKSTVLMGSDDKLLDMFRPHLTLAESLVNEPQLTPPKQTIRMSESIIDVTPQSASKGSASSTFRIFWSHSVGVPGRQYTVMDKLTGFLLNLKQIDDEMLSFHESEICGLLSYHPHILSHYHTFTSGDHYFVAQQYFEGTLESLIGRMTMNKVRELAVGIIEAIDSIHNDNVAHTRIHPRNIVVVRDVFKLTGFDHSVFNPPRELRYEDYNSFGRTLAHLAESMMLDSLLLKKEDSGDFMSLVYLLQQEECGITEVRKHPFFNRPSLI